MEGWKLDIDRSKRTIQGVYFPTEFNFWAVEAAVVNNVISGWQPTHQDMLDLRDSLVNPDPKMIADFEEIFGESDENHEE